MCIVNFYEYQALSKIYLIIKSFSHRELYGNSVLTNMQLELITGILAKEIRKLPVSQKSHAILCPSA
jgi:hypothetical protein